MAYCTDHNFLCYYQEIFGPIICKDILTAINNQVKTKGIKSIINDKEMFDLTSGIDKFDLKTYTSSTKSAQSEGVSEKEQVHLQFLPLAKKINIALGEQRISKHDSNCQFDLKNCEQDPNLIFIQIANSNYGGIYVFGDRRMPNLIIVAFRGTYSVKSAGSYTKPSSLIPGIIGKEAHIPEKYLTGIFKLISENIHSILYAMTYVSNQLGKEKKQILTTGHSLGGGLTTIFAYLWVAHITSNQKYENKPYDLLNHNICCVSIASPRVLSNKLANLFCCLTDDGIELNDNCNKMIAEIKKSRKDNKQVNIVGRITYIRNTMYRDPVTALPLKGKYYHPCSDIVVTGANTRKAVTSDCYVQIKNSASTRCWTKKKGTLFKKPVPDRLAITMDYNMPLDCVDTKEKRKTSKYKSPNLFKMPMGYHIMYNGISFAGALDPYEFMASANPLKSREESKEIIRTEKGDTVSRIIVYPSPTSDGNKAGVAFFDLSKLRKTNIDLVGKSKIHHQLTTTSAEKAIAAEDVNYTHEIFEQLTKSVTEYDILRTTALLNGTQNLVVFNTTGPKHDTTLIHTNTKGGNRKRNNKKTSRKKSSRKKSFRKKSSRKKSSRKKSSRKKSSRRTRSKKQK